jgi:hypothetical protein
MIAHGDRTDNYQSLRSLVQPAAIGTRWEGGRLFMRTLVTGASSHGRAAPDPVDLHEAAGETAQVGTYPAATKLVFPPVESTTGKTVGPVGTRSGDLFPSSTARIFASNTSKTSPPSDPPGLERSCTPGSRRVLLVLLVLLARF